MAEDHSALFAVLYARLNAVAEGGGGRITGPAGAVHVRRAGGSLKLTFEASGRGYLVEWGPQRVERNPTVISMDMAPRHAGVHPLRRPDGTLGVLLTHDGREVAFVPVPAEN